ncbi:60S acidic ribosomal protein P2 isoform X2 [Harpegnathos saltator]|uniref:Large ribosomal subunit protein P2 n=1 Tax=Harpegnathos saltator TaxID=610380 RepID=E2BUN1_HARSA|nr:60S acidic ribosomal protein P2 isoform X2 [Harpegnathos saltator]EFN80584.1 60S acidic ribosomal protein P2 [Harpegnathos saltator]
MRYLAAYVLVILGGKASPTENDIKKILSSVGIETDDEKLEKVISELNSFRKSIDELITKSKKKLSFMPVDRAAAAPANDEAVIVEEEEEEKEEDSESEDIGFGLFD